MRALVIVTNKCSDCKLLEGCRCKMSGRDVEDSNSIPEWCELSDPISDLEERVESNIMEEAKRFRNVADSLFGDCDVVCAYGGGVTFVLQRDEEGDGKVRFC